MCKSMQKKKLNEILKNVILNVMVITKKKNKLAHSSLFIILSNPPKRLQQRRLYVKHYEFMMLNFFFRSPQRNSVIKFHDGYIQQTHLLLLKFDVRIYFSWFDNSTSPYINPTLQTTQFELSNTSSSFFSFHFDCICISHHIYTHLSRHRNIQKSVGVSQQIL